MSRYLLILSLFMLGALAGPKSSAAGVPCQLNYPSGAELDWNGKTPGKNFSINQGEVTVSVSDCVGIVIRKGTVSVLWYHKKDGPHHTAFPADTKLTESVFENARSGSLLKEFHEFVGRIGAYVCPQCSAAYVGGERGDFDSLEELLQSAFSSVLVLGRHEIEVPFRVAGLRDLRSFEIYSDDSTHQVVRGIRFTDGILRISSLTLKEGNSYVWEAKTGEIGGSRSYKGRFEVADEALTTTTLGNLAKIVKASQGQISLRQEAAYYFEHGFQGNAIIALLQELNESAQGK